MSKTSLSIRGKQEVKSKTGIKLLSFILILCMSFSLAACNTPHVGDLGGEDDEWNELDWDYITVSAFDDVSYLEDVVYDQCVYNMNVSEIKSVEVEIIDQKDVSEYFDEDKIYEKFGVHLDANALLSKFAVGTGVIVICVALNIATAGMSQPIICIATGAMKGAILGASSGAVVGGIMGGIVDYIASGGDLYKTIEGTLEGAADGYMWGAVAGAITGAFTSSYCFAAGTQIKTENGYKNIEDIVVGDKVWSYNHESASPELKEVVNVFTNCTNRLTDVRVEDTLIQSTPSHNFYINQTYSEISSAQVNDNLFSFNGMDIDIDFINTYRLNETQTVYNFEVEDNHNYFVSEEDILVHNICINEEYAGKNYKFEAQLRKAQSTNDPNDWKVYNDLIQKYRNGVPFVKDAKGNVFPDFDEYAVLQYKFDPVTTENLQKGTCLIGDSSAGSLDFKMFRKKMEVDGYTKQQISDLLSKYTIHHHSDTQTLQLIPRDLHQATRHTGGASIIRQIIALLK